MLRTYCGRKTASYGRIMMNKRKQKYCESELVFFFFGLKYPIYYFMLSTKEKILSITRKGYPPCTTLLPALFATLAKGEGVFLLYVFFVRTISLL